MNCQKAGKEPVTAYFADRVNDENFCEMAVRPEHYLKKSLSRWQNGSWARENGEQKNTLSEKAIKQRRISDIEGAIRRAREDKQTDLRPCEGA